MQYEAILTRRFPVDAEGFPPANGDDPAGEIVAKIRRPQVRDRSFYTSLGDGDSNEIPEQILRRFLVSLHMPGVEHSVPLSGIILDDLDFWLLVAIQDEVQKMFNRGLARLGESDSKLVTLPSA